MNAPVVNRARESEKARRLHLVAKPSTILVVGRRVETEGVVLHGEHCQLAEPDPVLRLDPRMRSPRLMPHPAMRSGSSMPARRLARTGRRRYNRGDPSAKMISQSALAGGQGVSHFGQHPSRRIRGSEGGRRTGVELPIDDRDGQLSARGCALSRTGR